VLKHNMKSEQNRYCKVFLVFYLETNLTVYMRKKVVVIPLIVK